jgi:hypothetical protein
LRESGFDRGGVERLLPADGLNHDLGVVVIALHQRHARDDRIRLRHDAGAQSEGKAKRGNCGTN